MTDVLEELREKALLLQSEAWRRQDGGQDLLISANLANDAADEIERLRAALAEANATIERVAAVTYTQEAETERAMEELRAENNRLHAILDRAGETR